MVLFRGGLELNISEVISGSVRGLFQATAYFLLGMTLIAVFLRFIMNWGWIGSLMLGSILSQTGEVVIIPLAKRVRLKPQSVILLSLEAVMTSIFNIVFFYALLQAQLIGVFDVLGTVIQISLNFLVGIGVGALMGIVWLRALLYLGKNELAYMVTVGYVFLCYVASQYLNGSGPLSVLTLGLVLGNEQPFLKLLRMSPYDPSFEELKTYLTHFQGEISFILRAFFFVLLGLFFEFSQASLSAFLLFSVPIIGILLVARFFVVSVSTRGSPMSEEKKPIIAMCALGMTPVLLSFIALQSNLPSAALYILIVTNVIIVTNIVTSVAAAFLQAKKRLNPNTYILGT
jgi:NhaP-type Na+/H+ or K+/H+ antiporter